MGLSQRRVDETAWTHEQQHRGTAATPLATAILNLRHGQGAVARRLRYRRLRLNQWQKVIYQRSQNWECDPAMHSSKKGDSLMNNTNISFCREAQGGASGGLAGAY